MPRRSGSCDTGQSRRRWHSSGNLGGHGSRGRRRDRRWNCGRRHDAGYGRTKRGNQTFGAHLKRDGDPALIGRGFQRPRATAGQGGQPSSANTSSELLRRRLTRTGVEGCFYGRQTVAKRNLAQEFRCTSASNGTNRLAKGSGSGADDGNHPQIARSGKSARRAEEAGNIGARSPRDCDRLRLQAPCELPPAAAAR